MLLFELIQINYMLHIFWPNILFNAAEIKAYLKFKRDLESLQDIVEFFKKLIFVEESHNLQQATISNNELVSSIIHFWDRISDEKTIGLSHILFSFYFYYYYYCCASQRYYTKWNFFFFFCIISLTFIFWKRILTIFKWNEV